MWYVAFEFLRINRYLTFSLFTFGFQRGGRGGNGVSKNQIGTRGSDKVAMRICVYMAFQFLLGLPFVRKLTAKYYLMFVCGTDHTSTSRRGDSFSRRGAALFCSK